MQSFISQWQELVALKTPIDVLSQNYIACNLAGILTRLLTEWKSVVTKLIVKGKIMRYIEQMFDSFFHLIQICLEKPFKNTVQLNLADILLILVISVITTSNDASQCDNYFFIKCWLIWSSIWTDIKGTLMQIWKSSYMFALIWK